MLQRSEDGSALTDLGVGLTRPEIKGPVRAGVRPSAFLCSSKDLLQATAGGRGVGELPVADGGGLGLEEALDLFQQPGGDLEGEGDAGEAFGEHRAAAEGAAISRSADACSSMSIGPPSARYSHTNPRRVASIEWACSAVVVMVWCRSVGLPRLA